LLENFSINEIIPFIFWNDFWNDCGIYGPNRDTAVRPQTSLRYSRGRKVFVDFGCSNIGKETSLPHPAFIIYNFAETAIVVPTTSDDGSTFTPEMESALIRCKGDKIIFPNDTIINLHQIRVISKNRIIRDLNCDARSYILTNDAVDELNRRLPSSIIPHGIDLQKCIEFKLAHLYAPDIFFKFIGLKKELDSKEHELKIKTGELDKKTEDYKSLKSEYEKLEEKYITLRDKE
jgi:hypothetical protein